MKVRKILIRILLGVLIFMVAVLIVRAVLNYKEGRRLDRCLNALWEKGIPLSLNQLYPPCSDEDNAARLWKAAEELLVLDGPEINLFNKIRQDFYRGNPIKSEEKEELSRMIEKNRRVLGLVLEASGKPCFLYGDIKLKSYEKRIPNAAKLIRALTFLGFDAVFAAEKGDMEGALDRLRSGFRFVELSGRERNLISKLIATAAMKQLLLSLNRAVVGREAGAELLLPIIAELGDARIDAWRDMFGMSIMGERILYLDVARGFLNRKLPRWVLGDREFPERFYHWLIRPLLKRDAVRNLPKYVELEEIVQLPYYQARELLAFYREDVGRLPWYAVISSVVIPEIGSACLKQASLEAIILTYRTGLACRVFKARNGRYPESLTDLVPGLISQVPIDPFTGEPLVYKREGEGFVVYSLGSNLKDDGGRSTWEISQMIMEKDDDWAWRELR